MQQSLRVGLLLLLAVASFSIAYSDKTAPAAVAAEVGPAPPLPWTDQPAHIAEATPSIIIEGTPTRTTTPFQTPTQTPPPTATPSPTQVPSPTPTATQEPTATPTPSPSPTPTQIPQPTATPTPTATQEPTATPTPSPSPTAMPVPTTVPGSYAAIETLPWVADGMVELEEYAFEDLMTISSIDTEVAAQILSFPWAVDDISQYEMGAISDIRDIMEEHPDLAKEALSFRWVQDDVSEAEWRSLLSIRELARNDPELAWEIVREPFMESPFLQRDEYALTALVHWSNTRNDDSSNLMAQIVSQPWFEDGLDDHDAALVHAIVHSGVGGGGDDFRQALIETPYVASKSVDLPFSGVTGLAVVSSAPFPPDDHTLATLEESVRIMEEFMGAPLPVGDVILLLVEPEFWTLERAKGRIYRFSQGSGNRPVYISAIILAENSESGPPKRTLYHELGHFYMKNGPLWLQEGIAEFLEAYTVAHTGGEGLEERLAHLNSHGTCDKENIWQHVNPWRRGQCDYELGEKFLLGMYAALGPEAVSAALRELYTRSLIFENPNHDSIYFAFESNASQEKEEAFRAAFRRYHGGPVIDRALEDSPDLPPLAALYASANGDHWEINTHWMSDGPLGAWHGVVTNSSGDVIALELSQNALTGGIPSQLGGLSNLLDLNFHRNELTGQIPSELGNLASLKSLDLSTNKLAGQIPPELGNLTNLEALSLSWNELAGQIPPELGNLTNLKQLMIQGNRLSGEIPSELGNLTNLELLWLGHGNQFTGCIAEELPDIWVEETGLERCV